MIKRMRRSRREVIGLAVRWYLRYGLSYRDVEADGRAWSAGRPCHHLSVGPAVHADPGRDCAARCARHAIGSRWQVDETYVKVAGCWRYVYRAVDEYGQVVDVYVLPRRTAAQPGGFSIVLWPPLSWRRSKW